MRDLHNNISVVKAIHPKAVGTTGASNGSLSNMQDIRDYNSVELALSYGVSPSAVDKINVVLMESDDTTSGNFTSVADADLLGTEANASIASGARASGTTQNVTKRLGYIGRKRYLRARVYGIGTATAIVAANWLLGNPRRVPVT